jgi:hypothetical protein
MLLVVIGWVIFACVVGAAASGRGRSSVGWLILALIISPLLAGILLAILPDLHIHGMLQSLSDAHSVDDAALRRNIEKGRAS